MKSRMIQNSCKYGYSYDSLFKSLFSVSYLPIITCPFSINTSKDDKILNQSTVIPFTKENIHMFEDSLSDQDLLSQLIVHMDAYIHSGMSSKAYKMLMLYRKNLKCSKISTIAPYNLLIEAYTCNADLGKVYEIYNMIKVDSVKPDAQTYIYMLNTIATMKNKKKQIGKLS